MSNYTNKYNNYVLCLENIINTFSGLLVYYLKNDPTNPNYNSIKSLILMGFQGLPKEYFKTEGGIGLETKKLLEIVSTKTIKEENKNE